MPNHLKILLAGAGNLADALLRGWTQANLISVKQVSVLNRSDAKRLELLAERYGVTPVSDKESAVEACDLLVLAMKPHSVVDFIHSIRHRLNDNQIILSLAAGISTCQIEEAAEKSAAVVRAMPNTSTAVLESATAVSYGRNCTERAKEIAETLLGAVGTLTVVEESLMDAVTGLSGSGPAYFYYIVEAMQGAGRALGMPAEVADQLVEQTLVGAAKMLQQGELSAAELRRRITSPNGTTVAGISVLEQAHFQELMISAIRRATERATEMGQEVYNRAGST